MGKSRYGLAGAALLFVLAIATGACAGQSSIETTIPDAGIAGRTIKVYENPT